MENLPWGILVGGVNMVLISVWMGLVRKQISCLEKYANGLLSQANVLSAHVGELRNRVDELEERTGPQLSGLRVIPLAEAYTQSLVGTEWAEELTHENRPDI